MSIWHFRAHIKILTSAHGTGNNLTFHKHFENKPIVQMYELRAERSRQIFMHACYALLTHRRSISLFAVAADNHATYLRWWQFSDTVDRMCSKTWHVAVSAARQTHRCNLQGQQCSDYGAIVWKLFIELSERLTIPFRGCSLRCGVYDDDLDVVTCHCM